MELKIELMVAETAELKILRAEFVWLCEILADIEFSADPQKTTEEYDIELKELIVRIEQRLGKHQEILAGEAGLVVMHSVLAHAKKVGSSTSCGLLGKP